MNRLLQTFGAIGTVAALVTLSACSSPEPELLPVDRAATPVVVAGQAQTILAEIDTSLRAGVPTGDRKVIGGRAVGPFLQIALAEATIAAKTKTKAAAPTPVSGAQLLVPKVAGWPRFFVAAGSTTGQSIPVLRVVTSQSARSPYGLWASLSLLPGTSLPAMAPATDGSAEVADGATGLVLSPKAAAEEYADILVNGTASKYAGKFEADEFSRQVFDSLKASQTQVRSAARVRSDHVVKDVMALRTKDGGALVFASLQHDYTIKVTEDRPVLFNDKTLEALAGKKEFSKRFTRTSAEVVALVVPPAGQGKVSVIAGDKGTIAVKAT